MMRARSGTPASPFDTRGYDEAGERDDQTREADSEAPGDRFRVIAQLELPRAGGDRNRHECVISTEQLARSPVEADAPIEIPVFRDQDVAGVARRRVEGDRHPPGSPVGHLAVRRRGRRYRAERRRVDWRARRKQYDAIVSG